MSSPKVPTLAAIHAKKLDTFLKETVARRECPAVFLGVCNKDEILYFNQAGDKVFGDASQGMIDSDTSASFCVFRGGADG